MPSKGPSSIALDTSLLLPGMRLAVGVSGGADSVALLRAVADRSRELGLVLHVAHLHHGLRGDEAGADRDFCQDLAGQLGLPFHEWRVDTAAAARPDRAAGKPAETIEEAARRLRYGWFRELMASGVVDAVATAHTLDDQAETVLAKFLRGAWTEGLSGIHPAVGFPEGRILRPLLGTRRAEIEDYLRRIQQPWRDDSSNRHLTFTRNRIRHELLPLLEGWNPRLREHLAQMAELARDEDGWWETETARIAGQIVLPGRPVRGGGRAASEGLALEVNRLGELPVALQRRVLRHAAGRLGAAPDFEGTEALRTLALNGRAGQKCALAGLTGERTHRELRLSAGMAGESEAGAVGELTLLVPGEIEAPEWGVRVVVRMSGEDESHPSAAKAHGSIGGGRSTTEQLAEKAGRTGEDEEHCSSAAELIEVDVRAEARTLQNQGSSAASEVVSIPHNSGRRAVLRAWKPGDRVRLRHSGRARKVKEVLERMHITGSARAHWPVVEFDGRIVWMQGVQLEPEAGIEITVNALEDSE